VGLVIKTVYQLAQVWSRSSDRKVRISAAAEIQATKVHSASMTTNCSNRNSYAICRMVQLSMTLNNL